MTDPKDKHPSGAAPDAFERFGLPRSYALDLAALDAAYERLSLEHHPDFYATAAKATRAHAERLSAELNGAYRLLRDEDQRTTCLLTLLDPSGERDENHLPPGFLQEMFLLQEQAEELEASQHAPLRAQLESRLQTLLKERARLFAQVQAERDGHEKARREIMQNLQTNLNCGKYLKRLIANLLVPAL